LDARLGIPELDARLGVAEADAGLGPAGQATCDGIAAVIDFGDACTGDPAWDLAVLTLDDPGRLDDVLTGYAPEPRLAQRISALAGPYRLLRRLGEASWLADHGFSPEPGIAPLRDAAATEG
jgi:Ser/Thr protein kinase RdoA (MazF antagonist)